MQKKENDFLFEFLCNNMEINICSGYLGKFLVPVHSISMCEQLYVGHCVVGVACMFPHNLKIHLKTEHGVEEAPSDSGDGVTCEHCQKSFKHASYLKYHLVIRHGIGTSEEK